MLNCPDMLSMHEAFYSIYHFSPFIHDLTAQQTSVLGQWEGFQSTTHPSAMCQAVFVELYLLV
jgi:hypothetical protein